MIIDFTLNLYIQNEIKQKGQNYFSDFTLFENLYSNVDGFYQV